MMSTATAEARQGAMGNGGMGEAIFNMRLLPVFHWGAVQGIQVGGFQVGDWAGAEGTETKGMYSTQLFYWRPHQG